MHKSTVYQHKRATIFSAHFNIFDARLAYSRQRPFLFL